MARGVLVLNGKKWRSLVARVHFATLGGAGTCQWAGHFLPLYLICFLILPARSASWSMCMGGMNLFFPWPHGKIRSNESESIKQYPCLLGLFWPGAFHLIRTRCIRNKVSFSCHSSPTHCLQPLSSVNIWNFRIIQKNCVAEHLLNLGALWAGDARADFTWAVMNSHSVNAPSEFHGVKTPCALTPENPSFCALTSEVSVLFRVCVCVIRSVWGWDVRLCLFIYYLFILTHFLNPSPKPQGIISLIWS